MEVKSKFQEKNGIIYLPAVYSDGTPGESWVSRFKKRGIHLDRETKSALRSKDFVATKGVKYELAIIIGDAVSERLTTNMIHEKAEENTLLKLEKENIEAACLLRELLCDLGFGEIRKFGIHWITPIHSLFKDSIGNHVRFHIGQIDEFRVENENEFKGRENFDKKWTPGGGYVLLSAKPELPVKLQA